MVRPLKTWQAFYSKFAKENRGSTRKQASSAWVQYKEQHGIVLKSATKRTVMKLAPKELTKEEPPKNSIYILSVENDAPYHEGIEYWMRGKVSELVDIAKDSWDWMEERPEVSISRVTFGKKCGERIISFDELSKLVKKKNPILDKYPDLGGVSGQHFVCDTCDIVYNTGTKEVPTCKECQGECKNMDD